MKKLLAIVAASLLPALALAEQPAPPPEAPEVKKTVDAFVGKWQIDSTLTGLPGSKEPIKFKQTIVCTKAAGGRVASCTGKANVPGLGNVEDAALVTYDEEGKAVRFVGMSSMGDVHDHKCSWKDDKNLACEALSVTMAGQPTTVDLSMSWSDPKTATITESSTLKDGTKITFEGKGKCK